MEYDPGFQCEFTLYPIPSISQEVQNFCCREIAKSSSVEGLKKSFQGIGQRFGQKNGY